MKTSQESCVVKAGGHSSGASESIGAPQSPLAGAQTGAIEGEPGAALGSMSVEHSGFVAVRFQKGL